VSKQVYPAPQSRDWKGQSGGQLNPQFVEWLMNFPKDWTALDVPSEPRYNMGITCGGKDDANAAEGRPAEGLRVLREAYGEEDNQWKVAGPSGVYQEQVLRYGLHGARTDGPAPEVASTKEDSGAVSGNSLRTVWGNERAGYSPQGQRPSEQRSGEPDDAVQPMPYEVALGEWQDGLAQVGAVSDLRDALTEIGYVPETLPEVEEVWRCLSDEEKDWVRLLLGTGSPWCAEWPGVPRVATGVKDRVNKLRCLGNAVVPACAEYVGRMILKADADRTIITVEECGEEWV
jgi:hypothetical protein